MSEMQNVNNVFKFEFLTPKTFISYPSEIFYYQLLLFNFLNTSE